MARPRLFRRRRFASNRDASASPRGDRRHQGHQADGARDGYIRRFRSPSQLHGAGQHLQAGDRRRAAPAALQGIAFGGMLLVILAMLITGSGGLLGHPCRFSRSMPSPGLKLLPAMQQVWLPDHHDPLQPAGARGPHRQEIRASEGEPADPVPVPPIHLRERLELADIHYNYPNTERFGAARARSSRSAPAARSASSAAPGRARPPRST